MLNIGTFKIINTTHAFKTLALLYNLNAKITARANRKHIIIIKKLVQIDTQNFISVMKNTHTNNYFYKFISIMYMGNSF